MYKLINSLKGTPVGVVIQKDGFSISIPFNPANTDYQEFLRYKEAGGKVYEADEEVPVNG